MEARNSLHSPIGASQMTLVDAFQLLPLGILDVKIASGSTQCFLRSIDGPLKPTKDHLSIDTGLFQADREPIWTEKWHSQTSR